MIKRKFALIFFLMLLTKRVSYRLGCAAVIPFQTVALPFKVILHFVLFILIPTFIRVSTTTLFSMLETVCEVPFQTLFCDILPKHFHPVPM